VFSSNEERGGEAMTCGRCPHPAVGEAWNYIHEEWDPLCQRHFEEIQPDRWEPYEGESNGDDKE